MKKYYFKKNVCVLFVIVCGIQAVFAQNSADIDTFLDGDKLNDSIGTYIKNVSRIIPDSATLQNLWARSPSWNMAWGLGVTGSITVEERKQLGSILSTKDGFGGTNMDLSNFPSSVPFVPAGSVDLRIGIPRIPVDIGFSGLWYNFKDLESIFGDGTDFTYWTAGADIRGGLPQQTFGSFFPGIFLIGGYYFSSMTLGFKATETEKVNLDMRNDSYFLALQISEAGLPVVTPFAGFKAIWSKTDSDYNWETGRPARFGGKDYLMGLKYEAAGLDAPTLLYLHVYGGTSLFGDLITLAASYNIMTSHFGVELSMRLSNHFFHRGKDTPPSGNKKYDEPKYEDRGGSGGDMSAELARMNQKIQRQEDEISELRLKLRAAEAAAAGKGVKIKENEAAGNEEEIQNLNERITEQESELAVLREKRDAQKDELDNLNSAISRAKAELAEVKSRLDDTRAGIDHARKKKERIEAYNDVKYPGGVAYKDILINGGAGFGVAYTTKIQCPPLIVSFDWAVPLFKQPFSLGATAGVSTESDGGINTQNYAAAFRLAYHFGILDFINDVLPFGKLDLYAALDLGGAIETGAGTRPHIMIGALAGAHYYILDNLGAYMEVGYNSLYIYSLGITLKF